MSKKLSLPTSSDLTTRIADIIESSRRRIKTVIDHEMVHSYWQISREMGGDQKGQTYAIDKLP